MKPLDWLQTRRGLKDLSRIADALEAQLTLLQQLTTQLIPPLPPVDQEDLLTTGPTFTSEAEQARLVEYSDRMQKAVGRAPTAEELADFLDGKD